MGQATDYFVHSLVFWKGQWYVIDYGTQSSIFEFLQCKLFRVWVFLHTALFATQYQSQPHTEVQYILHKNEEIYNVVKNKDKVLHSAFSLLSTFNVEDSLKNINSCFALILSIIQLFVRLVIAGCQRWAPIHVSVTFKARRLSKNLKPIRFLRI